MQTISTVASPDTDVPPPTTLELTGSLNYVNVLLVEKAVMFSLPQDTATMYQQLGWMTRSALPPNTIAIVFSLSMDIQELLAQPGYPEITFDAVQNPGTPEAAQKASVTAPTTLGGNPVHFLARDNNDKMTLVDPVIVITVRP